MSQTLAERVFTPESDLATLVKCYLEIEKSENSTKFCVDNGLNRKAYNKIRFRVREIYGAVRENNPDAFLDNIIDASEDSEDEVSDADTVNINAESERANKEATFRRELAAIAPEDVLPTRDQ